MAQSGPGREGRTAWVLAVAVFVGFFDTFALLPVLPVYVHSLGAEAWQIGLAVSVYSLVGLLMQVVGGYAADVVGRKPPLLVSFLGAAFAVGLYGAVPSVWWLIVFRVLHALAGAFFLPALFALIGERAGVRRAEAMGYAGALVGIAAIVAPPIGGAVARAWGAPTLFIGIALMMAMTALLLWRSVPETFQKAVDPSAIKPLALLRIPMLVALYGVTAAFTFCTGVLAYGFPLLLTERGYTTATAGALLGWMALVAVPVMAFLRQWHSLGRTLLGLSIIAACMAVLWWIPELWQLVAVMGIYGVGFGLVFPSLHFLTFEYAPPTLRGSAFALLYVFYSGGIVSGPLVAGAITGILPPGLVAATVVCMVIGIVGGWRVWEGRIRWAQSQGRSFGNSLPLR